MTQYINKSALIAEIKRKIRTEQGYSSGDAECGHRDCAREILSFLDTLEVKEIGRECWQSAKEESKISERIPSIVKWAYEKD